MIPLKEQVDAIIHAQTWELANKYLDGDHDRFWQECSVTVNDLVEYVVQNGLPKGWAHTSEATFDGVYIVPQNGNWTTYEQERGRICDESVRFFESYSDALSYFLTTNYLSEKRTH